MCIEKLGLLRCSPDGALLASFDPLLIADNIDHDAAIRSPNPNSLLWPVTSFDFPFHRFDRVARYSCCEW